MGDLSAVCQVYAARKVATVDLTIRCGCDSPAYVRFKVAKKKQDGSFEPLQSPEVAWSHTSPGCVCTKAEQDKLVNRAFDHLELEARGRS